MKQIIFSAGIIFSFLLFSGCYAEPTDSDIQRVKQQFLMMRFHAPFSDELSPLSDKELFEKSCEKNRVKCSMALDHLKRTDNNFYSKLMQDR
ncbi:MAG: hypothetical protein OEZ34_12040 [Spirochaetia bacterium]|nr:hypothetical protein [Spirochaetia bacterium]